MKGMIVDQIVQPLYFTTFISYSHPPIYQLKSPYFIGKKIRLSTIPNKSYL